MRSYLPLVSVACLTALTFGSLGCGESTAPKPTRFIGLIEPGFPVDVILSPDTVQVGWPIDVTVLTFGSSTCTMADGVETVQTTNLAVITPYDRHSGLTICTTDMAPIIHQATVEFTEVGTATLIAVGYGFDGNGRVLKSVQRSLTVRE